MFVPDIHFEFQAGLACLVQNTSDYGIKDKNITMFTTKVLSLLRVDPCMQ